MKNKNLKQRFIPKNCRRGMTIEMAILFMLVVVALSGLAASATIMQVNKIDRAYERMEQRKVLDRIGEEFCCQPESYTLPAEEDAVYDIVITGTLLEVFPQSENGEQAKPVLTVELTLNGGIYTVTRWSYGE